MGLRFAMAPELSRFTVRAFAAGMLSFVAHSPTFAVRDFQGKVSLDHSNGTDLDLTVKAGSLELMDQVRAADREEIESRMRREVLEAAAYPEIRFHAERVAAHTLADGRYRLGISGQLTLHGVTRPVQIDAELQAFDDGIRLRGETPLRLSDFQIRPVTALAGAIKLKDELELSFDIAAVPEKT